MHPTPLARFNPPLLRTAYDSYCDLRSLLQMTKPNSRVMLQLINALAEAGQAGGLPTYIKCHCSAGQSCDDAGYVDPRTNSSLNFNFLPMLAGSAMGVRYHPVLPRGAGKVQGSTGLAIWQHARWLTKGHPHHPQSRRICP